jgi:hypothetical protein
MAERWKFSATCFLGGDRSVLDDEAADLVGSVELALVCERVQRAKASTAGFDSEAAPRLRDARDDEVLKQPPRFDVRLQLKVGVRIIRAADIARGGHELVQGNGLDHDSLRMRAGAAIAPVAHRNFRRLSSQALRS